MTTPAVHIEEIKTKLEKAETQPEAAPKVDQDVAMSEGKIPPHHVEELVHQFDAAPASKTMGASESGEESQPKAPETAPAATEAEKRIAAATEEEIRKEKEIVESAEKKIKQAEDEIHKEQQRRENFSGIVVEHRILQEERAVLEQQERDLGALRQMLDVPVAQGEQEAAQPTKMKAEDIDVMIKGAHARLKLNKEDLKRQQDELKKVKAKIHEELSVVEQEERLLGDIETLLLDIEQDLEHAREEIHREPSIQVRESTSSREVVSESSAEESESEASEEESERARASDREAEEERQKERTGRPIKKKKKKGKGKKKKRASTLSRFKNFMRTSVREVAPKRHKESRA